MCPETKSQISIRVPSTTPIIHYLWTPVQGVVVPGPRGRHWCSPPSRRADGIKTGRAKLLNQPCVLFEHEAMLLCPGSASHANIETCTVDTAVSSISSTGHGIDADVSLNANHTRRGLQIFTVAAYSPTNSQRTTLQRAIAAPKRQATHHVNKRPLTHLPFPA